MADSDIGGLTELTTPADGDFIPIVDVSEGVDGNKNKKITRKNLAGWTFLTTPLTSTSWNGDSFSTTAKTKIDLSAVFGVPAGVKAVMVKIALRDSGSAAASCIFQLSGVSSGTNYSLTAIASPIADRFAYYSGIVPCDANGDVYYQINASGSATMDVYLEIWGYWL